MHGPQTKGESECGATMRSNAIDVRVRGQTGPRPAGCVHLCVCVARSWSREGPEVRERERMHMVLIGMARAG